MKKKLLIFVIILLILAGFISAWFYGYYNRKNIDNIPSKELMIDYLKEQGEEFATEKMEGYLREAIVYIWGEPNGTLSGLWGEIWEVKDGEGIIVYFDTEGKASYVKLTK